MSIHPSAVIEEGAEIHADAHVGPFCMVGSNVRLDAGCELISHVVISGHTTIGKNNRFFPFSSVGHEPQDLKFHGEPSQLRIGDNNTFRENVTINPGTEGGGMLTQIGDDNFLMAYAHVAHDCLLENKIVMANCATLAGHVKVQEGAIIGGLSAIHQFVRIGCYAMVGGMSGVVKDVPPFCLTAGGYRPSLSGLNLVGLKRQGFNLEAIRKLKKLYRILLQGSEKMESRLLEAEEIAENDQSGTILIEFVRTAARGLTMHHRDTL
ncbi:MAG: acyl-ACP--UDP-N-acetylglucosamine O-acyltransferase [Mariprofundaceae bacterium]